MALPMLPVLTPPLKKRRECCELGMVVWAL